MEPWPFFFLIAFTGFSYLLIAVMMGSDGHDGDAHGDLSHDVGHDIDHSLDHCLDHGHDPDIHGVHHAHPDADQQGHGGGFGTVLLGWLSGKILAALLVGFGLTAGVADLLGAPLGVSILAGIPVGWIFGFCVKLLLMTAMRGQASSAVRELALITRAGTVTETILPGRLGEVEVEGIVRSARTADSTEIRTGTVIRVMDIVEDVLVVKKDEYAPGRAVIVPTPNALDMLSSSPDPGKEDKAGKRMPRSLDS